MNILLNTMVYFCLCSAMSIPEFISMLLVAVNSTVNMYCTGNVNNKFIERTGTKFLMRYSVFFSTVRTGMFLTDA